MPADPVENELRRLHLEAFALELRDCQLRLNRAALEIRARKLPESLATDAAKISADLKVVESCAWGHVDKTR
jgi:hypothetical protein